LILEERGLGYEKHRGRGEQRFSFLLLIMIVLLILFAQQKIRSRIRIKSRSETGVRLAKGKRFPASFAPLCPRPGHRLARE
jgi:hypothetical protein